MTSSKLCSSDRISGQGIRVRVPDSPLRLYRYWTFWDCGLVSLCLFSRLLSLYSWMRFHSRDSLVGLRTTLAYGDGKCQS